MNRFQYVTQSILEQSLQPSKRCVYRCGNCKHAWAYEYISFEGIYYRPTLNYLYDMDQDQQRCPKCNARRVKGGEIKGTVSSKPCSEKCLEASNEVCHCSCGGLNHAKGLVVG